MKHSTDVTAHRFKSAINNLAVFAYEHELSKDLIEREIEKRFTKMQSNKKEKIMRDIIQSCYKMVWDTNSSVTNSIIVKEITYDYTNIINSTKAITLAQCVIDTMVRFSIYPCKNKPMPEEFYSLCVDALLQSPFKTYDTDLLTIYCKQIVIMLKNGGLVDRYSLNEIIPQQLYRRLFLSFWNKCSWKNLFPSGGYISENIKNNRHLLLDMILSSNGWIRLDELSKTYFELTEIAKSNDLFAISLLDFSVITWLSFFGIIHYDDSDVNRPVTIKLTDHAYHLIQLLF